jgi:hypothetical protein
MTGAEVLSFAGFMWLLLTVVANATGGGYR